MISRIKAPNHSIVKDYAIFHAMILIHVERDATGKFLRPECPGKVCRGQQTVDLAFNGGTTSLIVSVMACHYINLA